MVNWDAQMPTHYRYALKINPFEVLAYSCSVFFLLGFREDFKRWSDISFGRHFNLLSGFLKVMQEVGSRVGKKVDIVFFTLLHEKAITVHCGHDRIRLWHPFANH